MQSSGFLDEQSQPSAFARSAASPWLNQTQFNRADGAGYALLAATSSCAGRLNPQLAARLMTAFRSWRMMESGRREQAEQALRRSPKRPDLSRDASDIVQPHTAIIDNRKALNHPADAPACSSAGAVWPVWKYFINQSAVCGWTNHAPVILLIAIRRDAARPSESGRLGFRRFAWRGQLPRAFPHARVRFWG